MNQIVEQKELFRKRRTFKRLVHKELFQLADWLRNNMDALKKVRATRSLAAAQATEALGFEVRASGVEAAENMIGRSLPTFSHSAPRVTAQVAADVEALKVRVAELEEQVQSLLVAYTAPL